MARAGLATLGLAALLVLAGCSALGGGPDPTGDADQPAMTFHNATDATGLSYHGSARGVGAGNTGVYASDLDRDGWTDLLVTGGERPALFRNRGGTFERSGAFPTVDAAVKSAAIVDYDGDGWEDVVLFVVGGEPVVLHNDAGRFERTELGLGTLAYPLGAAAADYDGDGDRDLFVYQSGNWANAKPKGYLYGRVDEDNGNPNVLYERTADGFERVADAGIAGERWSLAASFADLTGDGRPDVHVANDYNNDTVYVNRGDGTFARRTLGGATARNGMASEVADVTGDGRPDVFVTNIYLPLSRESVGEERYERIRRLYEFVIKSDRTEGNTLLVNRGEGRFEDVADAFGVRHGGWGWAASLSDFDNDGDRDLVHTTQTVVRVDPEHPRWTLPQVWQRNASGFARVGPAIHGMGEHDGRGLATLDFDRDGDRDVVVASYGGPFVVYENTVDTGRSLQLRVVDERGATALGATVTVEAGGATHTVTQTSESDFLSRESPVAHVGLGDAEAATLTVEWADGTERTLSDLAANARYRVGPRETTTVTTWNRTAG